MSNASGCKSETEAACGDDPYNRLVTVLLEECYWTQLARRCGGCAGLQSDLALASYPLVEFSRLLGQAFQRCPFGQAFEYGIPAKLEERAAPHKDVCVTRLRIVSPVQVWRPALPMRP